LLPVDHSLGSREILFHKITDDQIQTQMDKLNSSSSEQESITYAETKPEIVYDDFAKMDFRTGTILSVQPVPKSKKLLKLQVDLGFETRQILAGVAEHLQPEEMVGRSVVVVSNLAPRKMMGLESQGMVLMAEDPSGKLSLVSSESDPGSIVC